MINCWTAEENQKMQEALAAVAKWIDTEWIPAVQSWIDAIAKFWNDVLLPALQEIYRLFARFLIGLRRGLLVTRWYFGWPENKRPWFPWRLSRWLARRWPVRWLPRFHPDDPDEILAAFWMAEHLADPTW